MTAPQTTATTDPQSIIAALQQRLDAGLAREATLAEELAARTAELLERKTEFDERIEQQSATIDVLKTMSASPGDAQPVFDLIVERARAFCEADGASLAILDGDMMHLRAHVGHRNPADYAAAFPRPVNSETTMGRAIRSRNAVVITDSLADSNFALQPVFGATSVSQCHIPLLRSGVPIGAVAVGRFRVSEFTDAQLELLQTFAEQAVIAITSAETYRALQTRTSDLQETLEYQTATSDVLKVISRSTFDLQPVLDTLVETAARLCSADQAALSRSDGKVAWLRRISGSPLNTRRTSDRSELFQSTSIRRWSRSELCPDATSCISMMWLPSRTIPTTRSGLANSGLRLACRCCEKANQSVSSSSHARGWSRSPTGRSNSSVPSRIRR